MLERYLPTSTPPMEDMRPFFASLLVAAAVPLGGAAARGQNVPAGVTRLIARLDSAVDAASRDGRYSGVALVARLNGRGGQALYQRAVGLADRATGTPVTVASPFITASIAKTFAAVAVMRLVDEGHLRLDAPAADYLPDSLYPRARSRGITVAQLLTHTAGIPDVVTTSAFRRAATSLADYDQLLALVRADETASAVGTFRYGDGDYVLLGAIIRQIAGVPFADYVASHVFDPAGLTGSSYVVSPLPTALAHGYTTRVLGDPAYARPAGASTASAPSLYVNDVILPRIGVPGSVAYTTAGDLMRFADALVSHRLLSANATRELWAERIATGQAATNPANASYGCGFFLGRLGPHRVINHGGTGPGIDNVFDIYPDLGLALIVLANLDPPAAQDLRRVFRDGVSGLEVRAP
jgi:CubicO group peptidase (beta-lactamase class C family)